MAEPRTAQRGAVTPMEGAPPLLTVSIPGPVAHAAARAVLRWAGGREDDARTVLLALGLLPDVEHKATRWTRN